MRLIDAHDLMERLYDANPKGRVELAELIETEPTVDAVEVVRCKDCKWGTAVGHEFVQGADIHCQQHNCFTNHDSCCSWGEEKDDERNKSD